MIRLANKFDIDDIIKLLKEFAEQSPLSIQFDPMKWSRTRIVNLLSGILAGQGFILINEEKTGLLVAIKTNPFWVPDAVQLQEVMLYSPNKITMTKLVMEYVRIAKEMQDKGEIQHALMYANKWVDFGKLGLNHFETIWEL